MPRAVKPASSRRDHPMKSRSFGLTDAMILVVAVATGLSVNRMDWPLFLLRWSNPVDAHDSIEHFLGLVMPHAATMTVALLALRMRSPRPQFRRIARQPGSVACMVALAMLLVITSWIAVTWSAGKAVVFSRDIVLRHSNGHTRVDPGFLVFPFSGKVLVVYGDRIGFAVAGAWLALLLVGGWKAEPSWIDRLGRAVGWLWIVLTAVLWLRCYSI
jgi:hypothetical protein